MSDHISVDDRIPTSVKQDLVRLDTIFDSTTTGRDFISKKLESTLQGLTFSTDDPKLIEAQMTMVNAYLTSLKGSEDNASRRALSKLKQLETESTSKHSLAVTQLLSKINFGGVGILLNANNSSQNIEELENQVEQEYINSNLDPILDSELKTDPNDLS